MELVPNGEKLHRLKSWKTLIQTTAYAREDVKLRIDGSPSDSKIGFMIYPSNEEHNYSREIGQFHDNPDEESGEKASALNAKRSALATVGRALCLTPISLKMDLHQRPANVHDFKPGRI